MPSFIVLPLKKAGAYSKAPPLAQFPSIFRNEVIHRRLHPALAVRHAGQLQGHFDGSDGAENHRFVQIAEMADAEHATAQPLEPAAERDIELVEGNLAYLVGV